MKGYKRTIRRYYKLTTIINAIKTGSPTINNGTASGFSDNNYFTLPKPMQASLSNWEIVFKIITGNSVTTGQNITGNYGQTYQNAPEIGITSSSNFALYIPKDGTTNYVYPQSSGVGTYTVLANTAYWVKAEFTGSQYKLSYSLDGVNYITDVSVPSSISMYNAPQGFIIGNNFWKSNPGCGFLGSIDFTQSYIKINNEYWWRGVTSVESTSSDYDYYIDSDVYRLIKYKQSNTNVITHIADDIKLELNNGTLTLKAGSKVYVPNGFEEDGTTKKFDVIITNEDKTYTNSNNATYFLCFKYDGSVLGTMLVTNSSSGSTMPSGTWQFWYDTTNNLIKRIGATSGVVDYNCAFPLAIITVSGNKITSIDAVFNGFGGMGSTVFALPDVSGLIPNGFNADGSFKTTSFTTQTVLINTFTDTPTNNYYFQCSGSFCGRLSKTAGKYVPSENKSYWNNSGTWQQLNNVFDGTFRMESGKITSVSQLPTVQPSTIPIYKAVDLN